MAVKTLNKNNFTEEVLNKKGTVLVDFWASWCGPCRMMSPVVDAIAEEEQGITVGKVNVDDEPELSTEYGVMSIPTLLVFKDGKPVNQSVGARPKEAVLKMLR